VTPPEEQSHWADFTVEDRLLLSVRHAPGGGYIPVETVQDLRRLCADVESRRDVPVLAATLGAGEDEPVLDCEQVRALVGEDVRIYLICGDDLLYDMREMLGADMALERGMVRIFWPGAGARSLAADHPGVIALEGESPEATMEELALQFDLSRPRVRGEIRLIEDARAFLECELARAQQHTHRVAERLRDAKIECHELRTRAEAAEATLAELRSAPGSRRTRGATSPRRS
jgi:hypothetical protein